MEAVRPEVPEIPVAAGGVGHAADVRFKFNYVRLKAFLG
jgi:hypothetical protein